MGNQLPQVKSVERRFDAVALLSKNDVSVEIKIGRTGVIRDGQGGKSARRGRPLDPVDFARCSRLRRGQQRVIRFGFERNCDSQKETQTQDENSHAKE